MRRLSAMFWTSLLGALALPLTASADFTPAALVSGTAQLQFDEADAPALSSDGRYVAFRGSLAGIPGIYRRDLQTGAIELVAGGDAADPSEPCNAEHHPLAACDATAPSISADGRYIAFTTTADLQPQQAGNNEGEPAGDKGCPEVYVRDMGPPGQPQPLPADAPGAYTLASELNETKTGISFAPCTAASGREFAMAGAQAAPASAISADGTKVAFTVLSSSNLTRGPNCEAKAPSQPPPPLAECPPETPPSQVAVRDLQRHTTTLVTVTPGGEATPGGGAYPSQESESGRGANAEPFGEEPTDSTAAIDAEGDTVAWLGTNVPLQVPSAGEIGTLGYHGPNENPLSHEAEPLWRRFAEGPAANTERLLAGAGLDLFYAYGQGGAYNTIQVLDGSFVGVEVALFIPPALSADGRTVAVIADAPLPGAIESFRPFSGESWPNSDAYLVHVGEGGAPPQVTALTSTANYAAADAVVGDIDNIAISPDGSRVAFDTVRTQFESAVLAPISPPLIFTGVRELFEADVARGTLQRVSYGYEGGRLRAPNIGYIPPRDGSTGLLSFSGDGLTLAFASSATNLFYGDSVPASEVYLTHEIASQQTPAPQEVGSPLSSPPPRLAWVLSATATARPDGSVLIDAEVPGAGRLAALAGAQLPASGSHREAPGRTQAHARTKARAGARAPTRDAMSTTARVRRPARGRGKRTSGKGKSVPVPTRTVSRAQINAAGPGNVQLRLQVAARYSSLVAGRSGLYTVLRISFAAPGQRTLTKEIPVTFHLIVHRKVRR